MIYSSLVRGWYKENKYHSKNMWKVTIQLRRIPWIVLIIGNYINLSDFMTIANSYKYFSNFLISRQLNNNMSRPTRFGLLSLVLPLLWTLRGPMPFLTTDMIAHISRFQLGLRLGLLWFLFPRKTTTYSITERRPCK